MSEAAQFIEEHRQEVLEAYQQVDLEPEVWWHTSEQMSQLADGEASLVVTSPPYPMIEMWDDLFADWMEQGPDSIEDNPEWAFDEMHHCLTQVWEECYRVLEPGGILAVNIGDATRSIGGSFQCWPNHSRIQTSCRWIGFDSLIPIHWKKPGNSPNSFLGSGMLPTNAYVTLDTEHILLFRKGGTRDFEPKHPLRYASQYDKADRDEWFSQTWRVNGDHQAGEYATWPREIPSRLIQMFSILGDTVVDPFTGTGTTLEVARELGRKPVGYEVDTDLEPEVSASLDRDWPTHEEVIEEVTQ